MKSGKIEINKLLDSNRILKIPFFQRAYVWEEYYWRRFLEDMNEISDRDYFMGAIILKQRLCDINQIESLVIDGQQRLTTILVFLKVMLELNESIQDEIGFNFNQKNSNIVLEHNYNDKEIFEAILKGDMSKPLKKKYVENKVFKCYNYFKYCLTDDEKKKEFKNINLVNIFNHLFFICIDLEKHDDEQKIFDTMNSLGVSLSTGELLKNELFEESEEKLYVKTWRKTFEDDEYVKEFWNTDVLAGRSTRTHLDLLLHSFLLIKYPKDGDKKYQKAEDLFKNYKEILITNKISDDPDAKKNFIEELMEYAKLYKEHIDPDYLQEALANDPKDNSITHKLNIIIFTMNSTSIIPFVLYILKTVGDDEEKIKIFSLLESYLMRRIITQEAASSNYGNYFSRHIRQGRNSHKQLYDRIYSSEDPTSYMPIDEDLKNSFAERKFPNFTARLILYFLEYHKRPQEAATKLLAISNYSIEHVMPKKWKEKWNVNLPKEGALEKEQEINKLVHSLGNLTIVTPKVNSSLSNADWDTKRFGRKGVKNKRTFRECSSGIDTFADYLTQDNWSEETIKERGNELLELANDLWKYEGQVLEE